MPRLPRHLFIFPRKVFFFVDDAAKHERSPIVFSGDAASVVVLIVVRFSTRSQHGSSALRAIGI